MEAKNICSNSGSHYSIWAKGARLEDEFEIIPFQGKRRVLHFTRLSYLFESGKEMAVDFLNHKIILPALKGENFSFQLELVEITENKSRYKLKSLKNYAFKINGVWALEAFLERGDFLELGLNKIQIAKDTKFSVKKDDQLIPIPEQIIKSNLPILLEGETGTGKTTLAKKIHDLSGVSGYFVHLNISSFASSLVESELFGHVKGAFTGAIQDKKGAIREAQYGTLFIDEIDSLSLELQTKLLLFLESLEFRIVGSEKVQKVQTRLILASGTKLSTLVEEKKMRKDFYFRLKTGFTVKLDSIDSNKSILKKIIHEFEINENIKIDLELKDYYQRVSWPGNIRQLRAHLEKKKILSHGKKIVLDEYDAEIEEFTIPEIMTENNVSFNEMKKIYFRDLYLKLNKNMKAISQVSGIGVSTLRTIYKNEVFYDEIMKSI